MVAGYPWFGEWSRDTMTSYEGLFLSTRRFEEGRDLLARSAATLSEGMLANTADAGGLEYNTADGTLWFIHAVGRHVAVTGDVDILTKLNGALDGIIDAHSHGTRFGIKVDPSDGLLQQGAPGWALTWMDARVDGQPITQRGGKAVEINALWINALGTITDLNTRLGRHTGRWQSLHDFARESFVKRFARGDHLLDVVGTTGPDDSAIRPNQLLALSLPHAPFHRTAIAGNSALAEIAAGVVRRSRAELLTSLGMRSLSPHDPAYIGSHHGGPAERDRAVPPGNGLAMARRAVRRCCRRRWRPRRADRAPGRVGPGLRLRDGRRRRTPRCDGLPLPGVVGCRALPGAEGRARLEARC